MVGGQGKIKASNILAREHHGSVTGKARAQGSVQLPGHCRSPCKHPCLSQVAVGTATPSYWETVLEKGLQSSLPTGSGPDSQFPFRCSIKVSSSNQLAPSVLCAQVFFKEELLLPMSCILDLNSMGGLIWQLLLSAALCAASSSIYSPAAGC